MLLYEARTCEHCYSSDIHVNIGNKMSKMIVILKCAVFYFQSAWEIGNWTLQYLKEILFNILILQTRTRGADWYLSHGGARLFVNFTTPWMWNCLICLFRICLHFQYNNYSIHFIKLIKIHFRSPLTCPKND